MMRALNATAALVVAMTAGAGAASIAIALQPRQAMVKFVKPTEQSVVGGGCRLNEKKTTFGAAFPSTPDMKKPYLAFSIGPDTLMAKESHASMAPYHGAATYTDVLMSGNGGSAFAGLGTVKVSADG